MKEDIHVILKKMSDSISAGYNAIHAAKTKDSKCSKSEDKEHVWIKHNSYWETCECCGINIYWK